MRWVALLLVLAWPGVAAGAVTRYALVVGHNAGQRGEEVLRYAEQDARRVRDVLVELGGFEPANMVLLAGASAETVRANLIRLNDRIRTSGSPALLLVFYSGHADAGALHLGGTALPLEQLEQLVRGSAASFRLLIVNACRSGALTRVKGGVQMPVPRIELGQRLPTDGVVFWSSSSANEDAQESDELRGSFFTHYLVSGLFGAADVDRDGTVSLGEAYHHAYDHTLRATSKTWVGAQHATFRHETHGMIDVTLTTLASRGRALVAFPAGRSYLIMRDGPDGSVVAEVGARDAERRVSLRPGRYFVRARASDHLLEGALVVAAGERRALDDGGLTRVEYARLVRKGLSARRRADNLEVGYTVRTPLWSGASACQGVVAGWGMDFPAFSLAPRVHACHGGFANAYLAADTDELGAELRLLRAWDWRRLSFSGGGLAGVSLLNQRFDTTEMGSAPSRTSTAAQLGVTVVIAWDIARSLYVSIEGDGLTSIFLQEGDRGTAGRATFSARTNLLVGKRW